MELAVVRTLRAEYRGTCIVDREHEIKRRDVIGVVVNEANPMNPVRGYACKDCTRELPRATKLGSGG